MAVMPALMRSSGASGKGKKASEPATAVESFSAWLFLLASSIAILADMVRDIWPAPAARSWPFLAMAMALDLTCLVTSQTKARSDHSEAVGWRVLVTVHLDLSKPARSGC